VSYLALAVVAGLAAIERKGFLQAMLSRPVALGAIVGAVLGDTGTGLLVGIPLELLWLGAVNMGAALPIHEALGASAAAGGAVLGLRTLAPGGATPVQVVAVAVLAVAVAIPIAWIGRWTDAWIEEWNEHLYVLAERDLARGDARPAVRVNLYGVAFPFAIAFVLAPAGAAVAAFVASRVVAAAPSAAVPLAGAWLAFCGLACASGARSMRSRKAPAGFAAGLGAALVLTLAWIAVGGAW
jgi:PTS system mannose-specific IIC component